MPSIFSNSKLLNAIKIYWWRRRLGLIRHQAVFDRLYKDVNGYQLSSIERQNRNAFEYTYGEIDFTSFIALLSSLHPGPDTKFYDLGSGTGKAVIACALVFNISCSCGIECFKSLYDVAIMQKNCLKKIPGYEEKAKCISFINENFLQTNLSNANLIFINSTAFIGEIWELLNLKLSKEVSNATIITISKKLTAPNFIVKKSFYVMMSWGVATAYIHAAANNF